MPQWPIAVERCSRGTLQFANTVILTVADIDRAIRSDDRTMRARETREMSGTTIAARTGRTAGDGADDPGAGVDQPDCMVLGVDDEDVAGAVERHLLGCVEHSLPGVAFIAGIAARPGPGHGFDHAITYPADAAALALHHIQ